MSDDSALRLDAQLCFPLYAASRALTKAYQAHLTPLGLTYPQYLVMMVLWETDGVSVKALGERLFLDSGTLSPLLKRLEAAGALTRRRSHADERVVEVWLSEAGRALKARARVVPAALRCAIGLEDGQIERVKADLAQMVAALHHLEGPEG